jgi:Flp pilus assembly protein TadD
MAAIEAAGSDRALDGAKYAEYCLRSLARRRLGEAGPACKALAAAASRCWAWIALGMVLRQQGRLAEAETAYKHAVQIAPRDVYAHHNLGALLSQMDRAEDAIAALNRAQSLGLGARELHINRGRALLQLYRADEAESAYAKAVSLEPRDPVAKSNLAQLRFMRGDPQFRARYCRGGAAVHRGDLGLQLTWADLLRRSGD